MGMLSDCNAMVFLYIALYDLNIYTTIQRFGVSNISKKLILVFSKDAFNRSSDSKYCYKYIYILNKCCSFYSSKNLKKCIKVTTKNIKQQNCFHLWLWFKKKCIGQQISILVISEGSCDTDDIKSLLSKTLKYLTNPSVSSVVLYIIQ